MIDFNNDFDTMLKVDFKSNSTPQNWLVRFALTYILRNHLIFSQCETFNTHPSRRGAMIMVQSINLQIFMLKRVVYIKLPTPLSLCVGSLTSTRDKVNLYIKLPTPLSLCVGSLISTRDKVNLEYICRCKSHLTSQFYEVKLDLKFTS